MSIPTFAISSNELENLMEFLHKHEQLLNDYGAIKLQLDEHCQLALKKRKKSIILPKLNKHLEKINSTNLIYHIKENTCAQIINNDNNEDEDLIINNEEIFWSSINESSSSPQLNISFFPNQSFFCQKTSRKNFDLHRIPYESLLKLGGKKLTNKYRPCIKRAHRSGAIFPLNCTQQQLCSMDYHHEGGNHHWYIIPQRERKHLEQIIDPQLTICLNHGQIFIHPLYFEQNQICYYRLIQHRNELVILASGSLYQSFTEHQSWSESIQFALPTWIEQGYATMSNSSLCQCHLSKQFIDMKLFRNEFIQQYISSLHLHSTLIKDSNDQDTSMIQTENNIPMNNIISTEMRLIIPREIITPAIQSSFVIPSVNSYTLENDQMISDENNLQVQYELLEQGNFPTTFDKTPSDSDLIEFLSREYRSELDTPTNQSCQNNELSTNTNEDFIDHANIYNNIITFEQLMNLIPLTTDSTSSINNYSEEYIDTSSVSTPSSNTFTTAVENKSPFNNRRSLNHSTSYHKTLFVSGLRRTVRKCDIYNHFFGCIKVTIKPYHSSPHLKYAFVVHRTHERARRNLQRSIDRALLGSKCRVEYASNHSRFSDDYQDTGSKKLVVRRIPEYVNKNDLRYLFGDCQILNYCPARNVHCATTTAEIKQKNKILPGYAFLLYDNEQQAANVLRHADQYQINGQSLLVSVYDR